MQTEKMLAAKERFSSMMTACSVLSAILVVWIHAYNVEVYSNGSDMWICWLEQGVSQGLARGAVPFFFFASAFFLYSKTKTIAEVYRSRTRSLVIPYVLWNAVYTVVFAVLYRLSLSHVGMTDLTMVGILESLFLHRYNYAFWFMWYLIIYVVCYPMIRWILSRGKIVAAVGLAVSLALCWCGVDVLERFVYYYVGAIVGFYYAKEAESLVLLPKKKTIIITLALFLLAGVLFWMTNVLHMNAVMRLQDLVMMFLLFFIVLCFNGRTLKAFVPLTFMIYALHPMVLEMVEKTIYLLCPHTATWMLVDYILAPIICLAVIFAVCTLWKKVLPTVYAVFNGGRL